jgi:hypothetical protein
LKDLTGKRGFEAGIELATCHQLHVKAWVRRGIREEYLSCQNVPNRHIGCGSGHQ